MNIPALNHPERYQGLFVFDFGEHVAVGYTAEEVEMLLSHVEHRNGQAYRIHHASPSGELALRGMSRVETLSSEAMMFFRVQATAARDDFEQLVTSSRTQAPPALIHWHLATDTQFPLPHFTAMIYAAVYSPLVGRWLQTIAFAGGDQLEAGPAPADDFRRPSCTRIQSLAIAPDARYHSRPAGVVLEQIHRPVQRELG